MANVKHTPMEKILFIAQLAIAVAAIAVALTPDTSFLFTR